MGLEVKGASPPRGAPQSQRKGGKEEDWSALGAKSRQRFDGKLLDYNEPISTDWDLEYLARMLDGYPDQSEASKQHPRGSTA